MEVMMKYTTKKRRPNWRDDEVECLIKLWKKYLVDLNVHKGEKRNAAMYRKITEEFCLCYPDRNQQNIKVKMKNLMSDYRKEKKEVCGNQSKWKFYHIMNEAFQNLPIDDITFMQENMPDNMDASDSLVTENNKSMNQCESSLPHSPEISLDKDNQKELVDLEAENFHLNSLLTQYREYSKTAKEIDAKFLEGVEHLNQLQASSYDINFKMHEHIQKFIQIFGKAVPINCNATKTKVTQDLSSMLTSSTYSQMNTSNSFNVDSGGCPREFSITPIVKIYP